MRSRAPGPLTDLHVAHLGTFDDTLRGFLTDVDEIWHAGDIGSLELADRIAARRGNTTLKLISSSFLTCK